MSPEHKDYIEQEICDIQKDFDVGYECAKALYILFNQASRIVNLHHKNAAIRSFPVKNESLEYFLEEQEAMIALSMDEEGEGD